MITMDIYIIVIIVFNSDDKLYMFTGDKCNNYERVTSDSNNDDDNSDTIGILPNHPSR